MKSIQKAFVQIRASAFLVCALLSMPWAAFADSHHQPAVTVSVTQIAKGIYMLQGKGGYIGVSAGEDGMLLVDDEYDSMSEALAEELKN